MCCPLSNSVTPLPYGPLVHLSLICLWGANWQVWALWPIVEGHGARVWCQTGQASQHGPLCLIVMLVAYCGGPWGQGPVPDWTGQSAQATLPCYACGLS